MGWEKDGRNAASRMGTSALRRSGPAQWFTRRGKRRSAGRLRLAPDDFGWRRMTSVGAGQSGGVRGCRGSGKGAQGRAPAGIRSGECHGARTHVPVDVALVQPEPLREHHRHGRYRRTRQVGLSTIGERGNVVGAFIDDVTAVTAPPTTLPRSPIVDRPTCLVLRYLPCR